MEEQCSLAARYAHESTGAFEVTYVGAVYIADSFAVEFFADVQHTLTGDTLIVTGRYCAWFGEPELVWLDASGLHRTHPLFQVVDQDRELLRACEAAHQGEVERRVAMAVEP